MVIPVGLIARLIDKAGDNFVNAPGSDKKKSIFISVLLYGLIILLLFFIRFWPPYNPENNVALADGGGGGGGVTINFGDSDLGSGKNTQSKVLNVQNQVKQAPAKSTPDESILSQENATEESAVIPQKEKPKKTEVVVKETPKPEVVKPKVSNSTNDALSSILKGSNKGGDGDDKTAGNKGKSNGSLTATGYYGTGGTGGDQGKGRGEGKSGRAHGRLRNGWRGWRHLTDSLRTGK